jgi:hypothetical protein
MTILLEAAVAANNNPDTVGEWIAKWWPLWSPLLVVIVGGIITGIFMLVNRRGGEKEKNKTPLPPSWPEMWQRIDKLEGLVRQLSDDYGRLKDRFNDYVERVQMGGATTLTPEEIEELKRN